MKRLLTFALIGLCGLAVGGWHLGELVQIRAERDLHVSASEFSRNETIGKISAGQRVPASACIGTKSDVVPRVYLEDGIIGYIHGAGYKLEHRPLSIEALLTPGSIVFSCKRTLRGLSEYF